MECKMTIDPWFSCSDIIVFSMSVWETIYSRGLTRYSPNGILIIAIFAVVIVKHIIRK